MAHVARSNRKRNQKRRLNACWKRHLGGAIYELYHTKGVYHISREEWDAAIDAKAKRDADRAADREAYRAAHPGGQAKPVAVISGKARSFARHIAGTIPFAFMRPVRSGRRGR